MTARKHQPLTVGEVAKRLDVHPKRISEALAVEDPFHEVFPVKGHRRRIREDQLSDLRKLLIVRGILDPAQPLV